MQKFILLLLAILSFQATFAQFRVIDAATGEPLVGAYVLDSKGRFLEMSDNEGKVGQHKGQIQISMLSYEAQILDGEKQTADVALVQKPFELGEAVIGKAAYTKISGAFRDIVRFDGELVVYREGLVDFYYDCMKKKYTRRVRACRQYAAKCMTTFWDFKKPTINFDSFHFSKLVHIDRSNDFVTRGDSTFYRIKGHDGAILEINDTVRGYYRAIIDNMKCQNRSLNPKIIKKLHINDWTYKGQEQSLDSVIAYCGIINFKYRDPFIIVKNIKGFVTGTEVGLDVFMSNEFVVTDYTHLTKEEALREIKDKTETREFKLPDVLPPLIFDLAEETKGMKQTDFEEY